MVHPFDVFLFGEYGLSQTTRGERLRCSGLRLSVRRRGLAVWVPNRIAVGFDKSGMRALLTIPFERLPSQIPIMPLTAGSGRSHETADVYDRVKGKLVFGENVSQGGSIRPVWGCRRRGHRVIDCCICPHARNRPILDSSGGLYPYWNRERSCLKRAGPAEKNFSVASQHRNPANFLQIRVCSVKKAKSGQRVIGSSTYDSVQNTMNWDAFITTISRLRTATSLVLIVIALPLSYWVAFSRWRWKFLVEAIVALPLVLPPTCWVSISSLHGASESSGTLVRDHCRPWASIHIWRFRFCIGSLQSAVRGSADSGRIR